MVNLFSFVFLAASLSIQANGISIGPVTDLYIVNKDLTPDGFTRPAVLAAAPGEDPVTFPGPTIAGYKGDTFSINVINHLNHTEGMDVLTSVHWHGIHQYSFNEFDGAAFVNQCPIPPGKAFRYTFSVPEQAGTFWYHSHFENQYCDGLRGAFVVRDRQDPQGHLYDIDDDSTVITLADWYHYLSHDPEPHGYPEFTSTLINGMGRYSGGAAAELAVVSVQPMTRYRFRLISISCDPNWKFSIDNHTFTIIEVDGTNVSPSKPVDQIQIFAGQRYSFVLNANQPVNNYWIRAIPNYGAETTNKGKNSAILRYAGATIADPTTIDTSGKYPLNETDLHPSVEIPVPGNHQRGGADHNIVLYINVSESSGAFEINNVTYQSPPLPILLQILSGKPVEKLDPSGSIYPLQRGESVELYIPQSASAEAKGGPHPVHLHGHSFYVIRSAGSTMDNYENNPVIRDVVSIGDLTDNVTIRFQADNPGPWFLHCHIDWHLSAGFAAVFAEDVPDVKTTNKPPPCAATIMSI